MAKCEVIFARAPRRICLSRRDKRMNKRDIVEALHEKVGFSKRETALLVDTTLDEIAGALVGNETVTISTFGTFSVKERKAQKARNLKTGKSVVVPPRKTVTFKASPALKELVNESLKTGNP